MTSKGPWTKYGAATGDALGESGSTAVFSQSQTSADIVDIFKAVGIDEGTHSGAEQGMNNGWGGGGGGAPLAEKEVVSPTAETAVLTRSDLVNGFEVKKD